MRQRIYLAPRFPTSPFIVELLEILFSKGRTMTSFPHLRPFLSSISSYYWIRHQVIDASSEKNLHSIILQSVLISNSPVPDSSQAVFLEFEAAPAAVLL